MKPKGGTRAASYAIDGRLSNTGLTAPRSPGLVPGSPTSVRAVTIGEENPAQGAAKETVPLFAVRTQSGS